MGAVDLRFGTSHVFRNPNAFEELDEHTSTILLGDDPPVKVKGVATVDILLRTSTGAFQ